ncbi:Solute carrier family 41 member 1 [Habropoda laboriosa]|uniref:Solute carrier family 41 member 1 n=1 Tax=Habropoda laboriosa TaxID=597456 RepID=A0A0L7QLG7_9HYME|nr:Solute carrier family 41 member 1 [Habropoda laboriosa]
MTEDQVHQHPTRLPPDKHAHIDVTGGKFENDQCKEPLLSEKQTFHRIAAPVRARSRTTSSESSSIGSTVIATAATALVNDPPTIEKSLEEDDCVEVAIFDEGTTDSGRLPDVVAESKIYDLIEDESYESYLAITIQVFIPFLIAGLGMVGAGLVLDLVQHWVVFEKVSELIILVPALLGLKGNLEMTLASRLSTQANLGHMDTPKQQWYMIVGNLVLIQCQAIVVGFLGSVVAIAMGAFRNGTISLDHAYLLCASSLVTASVASFVLGLITAGVIVFSRHYWVAPLVIACYVLVTPLWVWIAKRNKYTNDVLYSGWTPVMIAMLISSCGGLILEFMVSRFENLTVFQPVINGVGGNLVAVQASRISTALHKQAELGTLLIPPGLTHPVIFITPIANFFGKGIHARTTRVLMAMVIPGHIIFIYMINYMKDGNTSLTPLFVFVYLCAAMLQVAALLYIAYIMIHWMWKRKIDPDNSAIPYLTAMGDLLGISLLAIAFQFLYLVGDQDSERAIAP